MPESENGNTIKHRKPANTAFKQQRLKAWQPILTPKTVLPTFFILGLIFVVLGAVLLHVSNQVDELVFDYTDCASASFTNPVSPISSWNYDDQSGTCTINFQVPTTFKAPVFLYYRLTNFYQNHRRYVKSYDSNQLSGQAVASGSLSDCSPLDVDPSGKIYYPCGLIANSIFNDTIGIYSADYSSFTMNQVDSSTPVPFVFSTTGISWPSDMEKYGPTQYNPSDISPPKDWIGGTYRGNVLKDTWAASNINFNPQEDEHFQVWMRTAGLPSFRKLYGRNTSEDLAAGTYQIQIVNSNFINKYLAMFLTIDFKVTGFGGTKSIVLSTTSFLGGKNPFLGISYLTVGCICLVLGTAFLIKNFVSPRKLGDHSYLSWNQPHNTSASATQINGNTTAAAEKRSELVQ